MRRPLYTVTAGELGSQVDKVENSLGNVLELAARWNAVLLLDEADVFLEQRSNHEIERNKLVSSKSDVLSHRILSSRADNTSLPANVGILHWHTLHHDESAIIHRQSIQIPDRSQSRLSFSHYDFTNRDLERVHWSDFVVPG